MKKTKKTIQKLLMAFSLMSLIIACDDSGDDMTSGAIEGGTVVNLNGSSGKLLGTPQNPSDIDNSTVSLTDAQAKLTLTVNNQAGFVPKDVEKYEIVKSFNAGEETVVASSTTLPFTLTYDKISDYFDGTTATLSDIRIGNTFTFKTKITLKNGNTFYQNNGAGTYTVTVNCLSDLAGKYNVTMKYFNGAIYNFPGETIVEVNPGEYMTESTGRWALGQYSATQGFNFLDKCGQLTIPAQGLFQGLYSNEVVGSAIGTIDNATGNIHLEYTIVLGGSPTQCIADYIKL